ncbi:MAG: bifunctional DNA-formamidopyrimidine glycosylase/DNA-(apurinic or apyrimidinic site) lyase [Pseudomonadota bacterium]
MPELPEVETVKRGLESLFESQADRVLRVEASDKKLRSHPRKQDLLKVKGQSLLGIYRRAKYLVFELEDFVLLSHLGMTGTWRVEKEQQKHDHIRIFLESGRTLTYRDPRRFGMFDVFKKGEEEKDPRFLHLGKDPVLDESFNGEFLFEKSRGRKTPVKAFIMDQRIVVGVGNIYASEALFLAGIHPLTLAGEINKKDYKRLAEAIRETLFDAIDCGGTTISDFKQAGGSTGYFQNFLLVYGRDKEECCFCQTMIQSQVIVGRNSYWCPSCQEK